MKLPKHISLYLEHNPHLVYRNDIESHYDKDDWISEDEYEQSLDSNEVWVLSWYPRTPVMFERVIAASLEKLLKEVEKKWTT